MDTYALIGYPLTHSFSKSYFLEKFSKNQISANYVNIEHDDISLTVKQLQTIPNLRGFNVTIPFKQSIIHYLDELDPIAKAIGAVNVVNVVNKKWIGFNTDYVGFRDLLLTFIKPNHQSALVLGTGGASKAVCYALQLMQIPYIQIGRHSKITYQTLTKTMASTHLIWINTTPIGMYPKQDELLEMPYDCLSKNHVVIDLIYNPAETAFMKEGIRKNAMVSNGLAMLKYQAEYAWNIWNTV